MTLKVPNASEIKLAGIMLGKVAAVATCKLRLFVNNYTPTSTDALNASDYTEMSTQGYAAITLTNTNWTISTVIPHAVAVQAAQTFTFDGTGGDTNVYGYYITEDTSNELLWAERFPSAPILVPDTFGGEIIVTPRITLKTEGE